MSELNQIESGDQLHEEDEYLAGGGRSHIGTNTALKRKTNVWKVSIPLVFLASFIAGGYWFYQKSRANHLAALGNKASEVNSNNAAPGATAGQPTSTRRTLGVDSDGFGGATPAGRQPIEQGSTQAKDGSTTPGAGVPGPLSSSQALKQSGPGQPLTPNSPYGAVDPNVPMIPRSRFDSPLVMQDGISASSTMPGMAGANRGAVSAGTSQGVGGLAQPTMPAFPDISKIMPTQPTQPVGAFGNQLTPSKTPKATATLLGNRSLMLAKGASIDCGLDTAFSSDAASQLSCTVTKNVYSDDGKVVLIDKGSKATGESGTSIKQGQTRVFVLWTRIKTPTGVVIDLDSPGADSLGRGGISGDVDNHFMERFGAAFLVSMFQDVVGYGIAKSSTGSNSTSVIQNTQSSGNSLATEIVRNSIGIPPTLQKNQGDRISISVARDLDFSSVYELKAN